MLERAANADVNQYIAKSRGGNTTKIHAVVDGLRNPVYFELSGGNVNDNAAVIDLLSTIDIKNANILGDKAYGTKDIRNYITSQEAVNTIPPKSNTKDPWDGL